MRVDKLDIMVEEPSMEALLNHLLPKWLIGVDFAIYLFRSKADLLSRLPQRLKGYARFLPRNARILVLVDKDDDDCLLLKARLEKAAADAGLKTKTMAGNELYAVANRIVVEELEAWYFGDWDAVRAAYPKMKPTLPAKAGFRNPDAIAGGTWEAFERIAQEAGYFPSGLRKIEAATRIAPFLDHAKSQSSSFRALHNLIKEMVSGAR